MGRSDMSDAYAAARRLVAILGLGLLLAFLLLEGEAKLGLHSGFWVLPSLAVGLAVSWLLLHELELLKGIGL